MSDKFTYYPHGDVYMGGIYQCRCSTKPVCATQAQAAAPAPAAPAPLTEDEAIDKAIATANTRYRKTLKAMQPYLGQVSDRRYPESSPGFHYCVSARASAPIFDRVIGQYSPATGQYERTVPYASAKPKPGLKLTNPWQLPDPWQLPEQPPDTVRSPEPAPELKPCYYCQHPPGSHAPACIEVKYGHV